MGLGVYFLFSLIGQMTPWAWGPVQGVDHVSGILTESTHGAWPHSCDAKDSYRSNWKSSLSVHKSETWWPKPKKTVSNRIRWISIETSLRFVATFRSNLDQPVIGPNFCFGCFGPPLSFEIQFLCSCHLQLGTQLAEIPRAMDQGMSSG